MSEVVRRRMPRLVGQARPEPERFRRIWQLVEDIARTPGKTRRQLAHQFNLSERQLQSDLNVIRQPMGLPLVRRHGYRFAGDVGDAGSVFSLAEAQLLLMLLKRAAHDPGLPGERVQGLMLKLPLLFPLHLRPLVAKTLDAADGATPQQEVFATLADALLRKSYVKLHYPIGCLAVPLCDPIVQPEVLFPYLDSWHLIGPCRQRGRVMVFDLGPVVAVTALQL
ncbi:MAG: hypothetical protein JO023_11140 [Chloroflexi bacterium]|nr:hypothetical protein [Chloroflexota bacterium]